MLGQELGREGKLNISFHKETKLLIAAGRPDEFKSIEGVLAALAPKLDPAPRLAPEPPTLPELPRTTPLRVQPQSSEGRTHQRRISHDQTGSIGRLRIDLVCSRTMPLHGSHLGSGWPRG